MIFLAKCGETEDKEGELKEKAEGETEFRVEEKKKRVKLFAQVKIAIRTDVPYVINLFSPPDANFYTPILNYSMQR